jgi:hypothetical protein
MSASLKSNFPLTSWRAPDTAETTPPLRFVSRTAKEMPEVVKAMLNRRGDEILDLAKTNLREIL